MFDQLNDHVEIILSHLHIDDLAEELKSSLHIS